MHFVYILLQTKRRQLFFFRWLDPGKYLRMGSYICGPPGHGQGICNARWYHFLEPFEDFRTLRSLELSRCKLQRRSAETEKKEAQEMHLYL